jgi:hypothetical protein
VPKKKFQGHTHGPLSNVHEHFHVTHYAAGGSPTAIEHLSSMHEHLHNHAALEHAHVPHRNVDREHEHEVHVHDHAHPNDS